MQRDEVLRTWHITWLPESLLETLDDAGFSEKREGLVSHYFLEDEKLTLSVLCPSAMKEFLVC